MSDYIPQSVSERSEMLCALGVGSCDELFSELPAGVRLDGGLPLPDGVSELEVSRIMRCISEKNTVFKTILRGAGAYDRYIPEIVNRVTSREEFLTAYTPYQAEISQGVLQSIFEYQTMICELTGMDVTNASVYDGASAAAEAVMMCADKPGKKALVSAAVNPQIMQTVKTYCCGRGVEVVEIPATDGKTDIDVLKAEISSDVCCLLVQTPNFYGILENADALGEIAHSGGAKYIISADPISLAMLKTPAEYGADIAVGEGQPLGIPLSFGGPYLGFMACRTALMRRLPGRIVGQTVDSAGRRAFVLTLQAREQHIRREKAGSNICSNQALCAMRAAVYMSAMGAEGMKNAAVSSAAKARHFAQLIAKHGYTLRYKAPYFCEFLTESPVEPQKALSALQSAGILGGLPVEGGLLWCVTEKVSGDELEKAAVILGEVAK